MAVSQQHMNGNVVIAIDTETTGLTAGHNEIIQIACVVLDSNFVPRTDINPFYMELQPRYPENIDATLRDKPSYIERIHHAIIHGIDQDKAVDLFQDWYQSIGIQLNAYGNPKKAIPLGQNYAFDKGFIQHWLGGAANYEHYFDYHYRDTMILALGLNDRAAAKGEKIPFPKVNLQYLATTLGVINKAAHTALGDTVCTAEVYKKLVSFNLGLI